MSHGSTEELVHATERTAAAHDGTMPVASAHSRERALRTARAVTLGLALAAGGSGCDAVTNAWCDVFSDTRTCCDRAPGRYWDASANRCAVAIPVEGPIVPPDLPRAAPSAMERA